MIEKKQISIKILNLYAGIGGNRKLWGNKYEITAIEKDEEIAKIYSDFYPGDKVIVTDAHKYLLEHANEYDFIWSSPPCPTHSDIRRCGVQRGLFKPLYPDMTLYQEIIFLQNFFKGLYVVENVKPYYKPLINPTNQIGRHLFWTNFYVPNITFKDDRILHNIKSSSVIYGVSLEKYKVKNKKTIIRNMVNPDIGLYLLESALRKRITTTSFKQYSLFEFDS